MNNTWYSEKSTILTPGIDPAGTVAFSWVPEARKEGSDLLISMLNPSPEWTVAEIGCRTGEISLRLASLCRQVYALDVSRSFLDFAAVKAAMEDIRNIRFIQSGFQEWEGPDEPLDAAVSLMALEGLSDSGKAQVLGTVFDKLRNGGILCLQELVVPDRTSGDESELDPLSDQELRIGGRPLTGLSRMRNAIAEAGLDLSEERLSGGYTGYFICRKPASKGGA